jgi:uncharacterized membrane protein
MSHKNRRSQKRERFAPSRGARRRFSRGTVVTAAAVLLVAVSIYLATLGSGKSSTVSEVTAVGGDGSSPAQLSIPLSEVGSGQAKFYQYKTAGGTPVRFFVIKSSDGVYRTAADDCVVCYREKMGYHQEGDDMVCNKCRKHFPSAYVNEVTGGCNPDGIPRKIQGDKLLIATSDLEARTELF